MLAHRILPYITLELATAGLQVFAYAKGALDFTQRVLCPMSVYPPETPGESGGEP